MLFKSRAEPQVQQQQQLLLQQQQLTLIRPVFYGSAADIRSSDHRPVVAELVVALRGAVAPRLQPLQPVFEAVSTALARVAAAGSPVAKRQPARKSATVVPLGMAPAPAKQRACAVM